MAIDTQSDCELFKHSQKPHNSTLMTAYASRQS